MNCSSRFLTIALFKIIATCTAISRQGSYSKTTVRVSDVDFDSLFPIDAEATSRLSCATLCLQSDFNTYYVENTGQCSCQPPESTYTDVATGSNYVDSYNTGKKI